MRGILTSGTADPGSGPGPEGLRFRNDPTLELALGKQSGVSNDELAILNFSTAC